MARSGKMGNGGGKRKRQALIETLEGRRLFDAFTFIGEAGVVVEGETLHAGVICYGIGPGQVQTVAYTIVPGTATAGDDYEPPSGTLTFVGGYGQGGGTIDIPIKRDNLIEGDETFTIRLDSVSLGILGHYYPPGSGTSMAVTITDDPPIVTVVATDPSAAENDPDETADPGQFTIYRTGGDTGVPISVSLAFSGTAVQGVNYTLNPGATVSVGTSATIDASIINDYIDDGDKTIIATLNDGGSVYKAGTPKTGTITVKDNDITVSASCTSAGWDASTGTVTVQKPAIGQNAVKIHFDLAATSGGKPKSGVKFDTAWDPSGVGQTPQPPGNIIPTDSSGRTSMDVLVSDTTTPGTYILWLKRADHDVLKLTIAVQP